MKLKTTFYRFTAILIMMFPLQSVHSKNEPKWSNHSAYGESVNDLCFEGDHLWIATGGGLVMFNTATNEFSFYNKANAALPTNEITSICPYTSGKIALGTNKGVAIFDTTTCKIFDNTNSPLISNSNKTKLAWINGNLYVASILRLYIFNQTSWKTISYGMPHMSNPDYISDLKVGANNNVFALKAKGIYQVHADSLIDYFTNVKNLKITDFQFTSDTLWMATANGLYASFGKTLEKIDMKNSSLPSNLILRLKLDSQKRLWLMTNKGLTLFNLTSKACTNYTNDSIHFGNAPLMGFDKTDNIWLVAKQPGKIWKFDGIKWFKWSFTKGIVSNKDNHFILDKKGNLWITNGDSCISKYNKDSSMMNDSTDIHHMKPNKYLFKKNKRLIFFVNDDVIIDYTDSLNSTVINPGFTNKFAHAVYDSTSEIFWKATKCGLEKTLNGVSDTIDIKTLGAATNAMAGLYLEKSGNILISTLPDTSGIGGQLLRYNGTAMTLLFTCPKPNLWVSGIITDADGNLWLGILDNRHKGKEFGGGIMRMKGKDITNFTTSNSNLPANSVADISSDADGNLWIGTIGGGLAKFDRKGKWDIFNAENSALPEDSVEQVAIDAQNNVYVATLDGGITSIAGTIKVVTEIKNTLAIASGILDIYPVPCTTEVNVRFTESKTIRNANISILNIAGQNVTETNVEIPDNGLVTIPVNTLPKGLYLLKVSDGSFSICKKLIIK